MQEYGTITMFRGGDVNFRLYFPGLGEEPLDLTGYAASAFEPHDLLEGNITMLITEPLLGGVACKIAWNPAYKLGSSMSFYMQLSKNDQLMSAPKLIVRII
jgi:hypothetical protein